MAMAETLSDQHFLLKMQRDFFHAGLSLDYFTSRQTVLLVCQNSHYKFLLSFLRTLRDWNVNEFKTAASLLIFLSRVPLQLQPDMHWPFSACPVRLGLSFPGESFFALLSYSADIPQPPARIPFAEQNLDYNTVVDCTFITGTYG